MKQNFVVLSVDVDKKNRETLSSARVISASNISEATKIYLCTTALDVLLEKGGPKNITDKELEELVRRRNGTIDKTRDTCTLRTRIASRLHKTYIALEGYQRFSVKEVGMQVQETDGTYREPESLKPEKLKGMFEDRKIKRILVFPAYDNGRPTPELRRAWRRYDRTNRRRRGK